MVGEVLGGFIAHIYAYRSSPEDAYSVVGSID